MLRKSFLSRSERLFDLMTLPVGTTTRIATMAAGCPSSQLCLSYVEVILGESKLENYMAEVTQVRRA